MSEASHPPVVLYERHENTAVIVLNRPHVLNAVNTELANAIGARLEEASADPGIHAAERLPSSEGHVAVTFSL